MGKPPSVDPRNELPSHNLAIACPVFAVLDGTPKKRRFSELLSRRWNTRHAPLEITCRAVNEHRDEEDAVEVWDGRCCADDQAPGEAHGPVCHVILYFADSSSKSITHIAGLMDGRHYVLVYERPSTIH
jgi:hypothetical protein